MPDPFPLCGPLEVSSAIGGPPAGLSQGTLAGIRASVRRPSTQSTADTEHSSWASVRLTNQGRKKNNIVADAIAIAARPKPATAKTPKPAR